MRGRHFLHIRVNTRRPHTSTELPISHKIWYNIPTTATTRSHNKGEIIFTLGSMRFDDLSSSCCARLAVVVLECYIYLYRWFLGDFPNQIEMWGSWCRLNFNVIQWLGKFSNVYIIYYIMLVHSRRFEFGSSIDFDWSTLSNIRNIQNAVKVFR